SGDDDRGQLHHADRGGDGGGHHIDDQKGEEKGGSDAKPGLQFAEEIGGRHDAHVEIFRAGGTRLMRQFDEEREIFFAGVLEHEVAHRNDGAIERGHHRYVSGVERNDGVGIDGGADWLHQEESEDERESDERLIAGRGLSAERLAEEMKDDEQAYERRHREHDGGNQGQQREQYADVPGRGTAGRGSTRQEAGQREAGSRPGTRPERRGGEEQKEGDWGTAEERAMEERGMAIHGVYQPTPQEGFSPACSPLADSSGNCASIVTEEGLDPIRKRWRSNWMTETKRRSPRAGVWRRASVLRLLPARRTNDNDPQITERQTSLRRSAASASQRVQLGRVGVGTCVCVISIFSNFIGACSVSAKSIWRTAENRSPMPRPSQTVLENWAVPPGLESLLSLSPRCIAGLSWFAFGADSQHSSRPTRPTPLSARPGGSAPPQTRSRRS